MSIGDQGQRTATQVGSYYRKYFRNMQNNFSGN
jgi:hypothetical protein